jgi:selenocysteine lyase/cysteine desulfurase
MLPNVTIAAAVLLSSLEYRPPRNRIVMLDGEFPTIRYLCETLGPRLGAEVIVVPSPGGDGLSADEWRVCDAIDGRTALVAISHVLFKSAFVLDVAAIAGKCRREGALLALDAYQSVGTIPVSVGALGADFLVGGVLKWLCGGPGGAVGWRTPLHSISKRRRCAGATTRFASSSAHLRFRRSTRRAKVRVSCGRRASRRSERNRYAKPSDSSRSRASAVSALRRRLIPPAAEERLPWTSITHSRHRAS